MLYLASCGTSDAESAKALEQALELEPHFLEVVLAKLKDFGLLEQAGDSGEDVVLGRPPSEIALEDVVVAMEGWGIFASCILGLPGCGERDPCPLHDRWALERERLALMFQSMTLEEAARDIERVGLRLTDE